MKKTFLSIVMLFLIICVFTACSFQPKSFNNDSSSQESLISNDSPQVNLQNIKIVDFPNPNSLLEYNSLTDDQKVAFSGLGKALKDICENGPQPQKIYDFEKRVTWKDFRTVFDIYYANFTVLEDLLINLHAHDSLGTQDHADSILLYDDGQLERYWLEYVEVAAEADKILKSLQYDGTEYDSAFTIAKWLVDHVTYPENYENRMFDGLNTAYTTLIKREAVCDGFAKSFNFLCKKAGLNTIYVTGNSGNLWHAWNMICINEKWYHIDVTWMGPENGYYSNFMMPDEVSILNGHPVAEYGLLLEPPVADSYDLYKYYYAKYVKCADALDDYGSMEIVENKQYYAYFSSEIEKEKFIHSSGNVIIDSKGKKYVIRIIKSSLNGAEVCLAQFIDINE